MTRQPSASDGSARALLVCLLVATMACDSNLDIGKDTDAGSATRRRTAPIGEAITVHAECSMFGGKPDCGAPVDWARLLTPECPSVYTAMSIASDAEGNSYVFSSIFGTVKFGDRKVGVDGGQSALLVSYAPDGDVRWIREIDGGYASGVAQTGDHVCVFGGDADRHVALAKLLDPDVKGFAFLACYDLAGAHVWSRRIDGLEGSTTTATPMAGGSHGNLYLAGSFSGMLEVAAALTTKSQQSADARSPPTERRRRELRRRRRAALSSHVRRPGL